MRLDLRVNNVKSKDWYFVLDQVQLRTGLGCVRLIMLDYLKSLITLSTLSYTSSNDMGHLLNTQRYTSESLTPTQTL